MDQLLGLVWVCHSQQRRLIQYRQVQLLELFAGTYSQSHSHTDSGQQPWGHLYSEEEVWQYTVDNQTCSTLIQLRHSPSRHLVIFMILCSPTFAVWSPLELLLKLTAVSSRQYYWINCWQICVSESREIGGLEHRRPVEGSDAWD